MANGPAYVDPVLTEVSQKYTNAPDAFIADKLLPVIVVPKKTGKYWAYNKDNLRVGATDIDLRTGRSQTAEASFGKSLSDFGPLQEHALKDFITKDEYEMTDSPLSAETDVVEFLSEKMTLARELSAANILRSTTVITQNTTLSGTSQFNDYANSDPFVSIKNGVIAARNSSFKVPNTISMGWDVWMTLVDHPKFLDRIKWNQTGVITEADFLKLFAPYGITKLFIGKAMRDTSVEGQTATTSSIWGKDVLIAYVTDSPSLRTVNGGYTLVLKNGKYVDKWDDNDPKGKWVRNNDYYLQMLFATDLYYLIKNAIA